MRLLMAAALAVCFFGAGAKADCGPDAPPAAIAAFGLTCETFHDGPFSTGTMDLSNTATISNPAGSCASGKCNWYTDSNFSDSAIGAQCPGVLGTCVPMPSSTVSISSGVLTLNRTSAYSASRVDLSTCKASATSPGYFGYLFHTPAYVEFSATYTGGMDSATAEAAIWSLSINYLVGGVRIMDAIELDYLEGAGSPGPRHTNHILTSGTSGVQTEYFVNMLSSNSSGHPVNGSVMIPQWRNPNNDGAATGVQLNYDAGVLIGSNNLVFGDAVLPSYNGGSPAGSPPDTNVGGFSTLNSDSFCLFMGAGEAIPLVVTYIRVWELPPTGGTRSGPFHAGKVPSLQLVAGEHRR